MQRDETRYEFNDNCSLMIHMCACIDTHGRVILKYVCEHVTHFHGIYPSVVSALVCVENPRTVRYVLPYSRRRTLIPLRRNSARIRHMFCFRTVNFDKRERSKTIVLYLNHAEHQIDVQ
jgi:uncharacterized membrane protein